MKNQEILRMDTDRPEKRGKQHPTNQYPPESYEIMVQGHLDSLWAQWFEGMTLSNVENGDSGLACTLIAGPVAGQPALHGLLIKIRDLNLKLLSVRRISPQTKTSEEISIDLT
jgi:hypothetical protein